ncbi:MAG: hypothetical protein AAFO07_05510 [Bacteroidota bacterium]
MLIDPEIEAIAKSYEVIKDLDPASKKRVISWLVNKFQYTIDDAHHHGNIHAGGSGMTNAGNNADVTKELPEDLTGFETAEALYTSLFTKTEPEKVLVVAAYLQEKEGLVELGGRRINSELKKIGEGVKNITAAISSLTKKTPPLMTQSKKEGSSPQAKKQYQVTADGIEKVNQALKKGKLKL